MYALLTCACVGICTCRFLTVLCRKVNTCHHMSACVGCYCRISYKAVWYSDASLRIAWICIHAAEHVTHVASLLSTSWADTEQSRLQTIQQRCSIHVSNCMPPAWSKWRLVHLPSLYSDECTVVLLINNLTRSELTTYFFGALCYWKWVVLYRYSWSLCTWQGC
jgi:hypothetical protein